MSLDDIKKKLLDSKLHILANFLSLQCSGMHPRKAQKPELRQAREQAAKESGGRCRRNCTMKEIFDQFHFDEVTHPCRKFQEAKAKQMAEKKKASSSPSLGS